MSDLVARAASGDLAAVEEIRAVLSARPTDIVLWSGKTDRRYRARFDDTTVPSDDLTIKVIAAWLRANGAATPVAPGPELAHAPRPSSFRPVVVEAHKGRGLRLPWRHRGHPHHGLRR